MLTAETAAALAAANSLVTATLTAAEATLATALAPKTAATLATKAATASTELFQVLHGDNGSRQFHRNRFIRFVLDENVSVVFVVRNDEGIYFAFVHCIEQIHFVGGWIETRAEDGFDAS
ncbi:MAG: hypothetical protein HUJ26_14460 [Planctomycetaceae bacterium]|nr:hypothetical protein [Planctomycetaceae bacterium]